MRSRTHLRRLAVLAMFSMLISGCTRAIRDGVSVGLTEGLSDGISQVVSEFVTSLNGTPDEE